MSVICGEALMFDIRYAVDLCDQMTRLSDETSASHLDTVRAESERDTFPHRYLSFL